VKGKSKKREEEKKKLRVGKTRGLKALRAPGVRAKGGSKKKKGTKGEGKQGRKTIPIWSNWELKKQNINSTARREKEKNTEEKKLAREKKRRLKRRSCSINGKKVESPRPRRRESVSWGPELSNGIKTSQNGKWMGTWGKSESYHWGKKWDEKRFGELKNLP